jgi:exopolysaccharide biosynthesis polyprenyl glycosylphosphotransferase
MNTTAARASAAKTVLDDIPPRELFAEGDFEPRQFAPGWSRGRNLARGLSVQLTYAAIDATLVWLVGAAVLWMRFGVAFPFSVYRQSFDQIAGHAYVGFFLMYAALIVLGCASQVLYRTPRDRSVLDENLKVAKAVGLATLLLVLFIFTSGNKEISRKVIVSAGVLNVVVLSSWRYCKRQLVLQRTIAGIGAARVLIVGAGKTGRALADWLEQNRHLGYLVCGFLDMKPSTEPRVLGAITNLRNVALTQFVDELFITLPSDRELVKDLVLEARQLRLGLKIVPDLYDGLGWRAPLHMMGGFPVMDLHWQPIPAVGLAVKRILDIFVGSTLLVLTAPLLCLLAILIRLDSPGPALYIADRVGRKGQRFRCYKLRTMVADANERKEQLRNANERQGPFFKMENDPRVTRLGRWLRKSSLDEIPQLWNVLRGDMSLVGPRPHPLDDYERYSVENLRRLDVSPGLTGLWQVTARKDASFDTNMALDLEYIENWSLGLDLKILLKTLPAVLRAEGS